MAFVTPSGRRVLAEHLGAPLSGGDPTADDTGAYVVTLDGAVLATTPVLHNVSTAIGTSYEQASGTTAFGSGSQLAVGAVYRMGNGAEAIFDQGTHVVQGTIEAAEGVTPVGFSTTGDQTDFIIDPGGFRDTPFSMRGNHTLGDDVQIESPVTADAGTTISGSYSATLDEVNIRPPATETFRLTGAELNVISAMWGNGQIRLSDGAALNVQDMTIDQTSTNLAMSDDGDPTVTETASFTGLFTVAQTGQVPPRIGVPASFSNGSRVEIAPATEIVLSAGGSFGGEVALGDGSALTLQDGEFTVLPTAEILGPLGITRILDVARVDMQVSHPQMIDMEVDLRGELRPIGDILLPEMTISVDGGRIVGNGSETSSLTAQYSFNPESSVRRATVSNVTARFLDGSSWLNGHIDFIDGALGVVTEGTTFVVSHTATNLQITEDSNPSTEETLVIQGQVTIDQTASVAPSWDIPTEVASDGNLVIEPGQKLNVPNQLTVQGGLTVRDGADARFTFVDSEVDPEGFLAGDGSITQQLGGRLLLNGAVNPGDGGGDIGTLTFVGAVTLGASSVTVFDMEKDGDDPLRHDLIQTNNGASLDGTMRARVVPGDPVDEVVVLMTGGPITGEWSSVEVEGASSVDLNYTGSSVEAELHRSQTRKIIQGTVVHDIDRDGRDRQDVPQAGIVVELVDNAGQGEVIGTYVTPEDSDTFLKGIFRFEGELDGAYLVRLVLDPAQWEPLVPESGGVIVLVNEEAPLFLADFVIGRPTERIEVTILDEGGPGSLRAAIEQANASDAPSAEIDISGVEGRIFYTTPLPALTKRGTLKGLSEPPPLSRDGVADGDRVTTGDLSVMGHLSAPGDPFATGDLSSPDGLGAAGRSLASSPLSFGGDPTRLVLDGSNCVDCDGLVLAGGESAIRGIAIENFEGYGLVIQDSSLTYVSDTRITGNGAGGILIRSGNQSRIGAGSNGVANEITANDGPGITVLDGTGHDLQGNVIFANTGLAIDLGDDGPTPNDPRDTDAGPNELQNAPVLTGADPLGLSVQGTLESRPSAEYVIEIYGSEICPEGDRGDLQVLLGSGVVVTDADGLVDFDIETTPYAGQLSAIATSASGSTSEVSPCFTSVATGVPESADLEFFHQAFPNPSAGPATLRFRMPHGGPVEASLHDVTGRRLVTIYEGELSAGSHEIEWDGRDGRGRHLHSGIYFYTLKMGGKEARGRIVTIR